MENDVEGSGHGLGGLRKTTKNLSQNARSPAYEAECDLPGCDVRC
jgi:hypothetical protein